MTHAGTRSWTTRAAMVGAGGLAAGAGVLGPVSAAHADSAPLTYACSTPQGELTVTWQTDAPAELEAGARADVGVIGSVDVSDDLLAAWKDTGATAFFASGRTTLVVDGTSRDVDLAVGETSVQHREDAQAAGSAGSIEAGASDVEIEAGEGLALTVVLRDDEGNEVGEVDVVCALSGDQDRTIDVVETATSGNTDEADNGGEDDNGSGEGSGSSEGSGEGSARGSAGGEDSNEGSAGATGSDGSGSGASTGGSTAVPTSVAAGSSAATTDEGSKPALLLGAGLAGLLALVGGLRFAPARARHRRD